MLTKTKYCMYCGKKLGKYEGNNPDDGLHDIPIDKVCCSDCDFITVVNRHFKMLIDRPYTAHEQIASLRFDIDRLEQRIIEKKERQMNDP